MRETIRVTRKIFLNGKRIHHLGAYGVFDLLIDFVIASSKAFFNSSVSLVNVFFRVSNMMHGSLLSEKRSRRVLFVVDMMGATKNIEHHPCERYHPYKEPHLNDPQCHGRRPPLSMELIGLFMDTCDTVRNGIDIS